MQSFKIRFRLHDLLFYLLLVVSFYYTRNMLCRLMMVVFFGYTVLQTMVKKSKVPVPFFYVGFLAFILYGAGNIVLDNVINAGIAQTMVISLVLNFLMIVAIVQYIYMTDDIVRVLRVAEIGIFSTAIVVVMLSLGTITQGRLGGGTEMNANMLALLSVYGFVISMYLRKVRRITCITTWLRAGFYLLVILLTGSRKGLLMIVFAVVILRLVVERKKLVKNLLIIVGMAAMLYFLIMNVSVLYNIVGVRVENLLTFLSKGETAEASLSDRHRLTQIGMSYVKENPWIGYGYDCFKLVSGMGPSGSVPIGKVGFYSHNNYVELLFGGGIIGFALYYIPVAYLLKRIVTGLRVHNCAPYLLAILLSKLAMEYAYVSYYERVDAYITAILLGCALIACKGRKNEKPDNCNSGM